MYRVRFLLNLRNKQCESEGKEENIYVDRYKIGVGTVETLPKFGLSWIQKHLQL